ncbi:MAG TPA: serine hydrolase domain-containing protein [Caulobacteraceae bacterium]|jgi:CubicO group peptidase (beta-lactamase class C family)
MMKWILAGALVAGALTGAAFAEPAATLPAPDRVLFWTPAEQVVGYRNMEKIFPTRPARRGPAEARLPHDPGPFDVSYSFDGSTMNAARFMERNRVSGLIVVQHGRILLERYGLGRKDTDRWTSFSVAKSITSTLIGAAIRDGYIAGLDAPVTRYMPELAGSAYDGATVGDLITMRSGVKWNEDYADPKSDVARFASSSASHDGVDPIEAYMAKLPRAHQPGTVFHYDTGETDLAGLLVARATKKHLADYLSEKIWSKIGAEQDAVWVLDGAGMEHGGCCISMTLRDYARFGLFFMRGGQGVLPEGWVKDASTAHVATGYPGVGYGYFWWIGQDGSYAAEGVFGQEIYLDPRHDLVVVANSAWAHADDGADWGSMAAFMAAVSRTVR